MFHGGILTPQQKQPWIKEVKWRELSCRATKQNRVIGQKTAPFLGSFCCCVHISFSCFTSGRISIPTCRNDHFHRENDGSNYGRAWNPSNLHGGPIVFMSFPIPPKHILRLHPAPVGKCSSSRAVFAAGSISSTESASTDSAKMIPSLAAAVRHFPEPCARGQKHSEATSEPSKIPTIRA